MGGVRSVSIPYAPPATFSSEPRGPNAPGAAEGTLMLDILLVALVAILAAAAIGYAYACEQL